MAADVPLFNKDKHVSYWLRCLRSPLPTAYTSNDASRMTLAFFTISALDLLGVLFTKTTVEEREEYIHWIYSCQHSTGGFRGFPGTDFGEHATPDNALWDPANLAATFFATSTLCVLGDNLSRLDRHGCMTFIKGLQTEDGGFAELRLGTTAIGGGDPRFAYMAASLSWILGGTRDGAMNALPDVDVPALIQWLRNAETGVGGFAPNKLNEAQAGLTFCAIATFRFLDLRKRNTVKPGGSTQFDSTQSLSPQNSSPTANVPHPDRTIQWLVSLFTSEISEEDYGSVVDAASPSVESIATRKTSDDSELLDETSPTFQKLRSVSMKDRDAGKKGLTAEAFLEEKNRPVCWAGFGGRCNKIADTCYGFWAGASLKMLGGLDFVDLEHFHHYMLEKSQHTMLGGFGKLPGDLPDIYHSYLGLSALTLIDGHKKDGYYIGPDVEDAEAVVGRPMPRAEIETRASDTERTLRTLDPMLCISTGARNWIESLPWHQGG